MDFTYRVIFEPAEEGGYVAHIPALNNSVTQGETLEEARAMAQDLIEGYIESLIVDGLPIPQETGTLKGDTVTARISVQAV